MVRKACLAVLGSLPVIIQTHSITVQSPSGPSADCIALKRIKTEPPDGEIIQVTVPGK